MNTAYRLNFLKKVPPKFIEDVNQLLHQCIFMNVNIESLNASIGTPLYFQGQGEAVFWFWDKINSVKKSIHIDFKNGIVSDSKEDNYLNIFVDSDSVYDQKKFPISISMNVWGLHFFSMQFFNKTSVEEISNPIDIKSYEKFIDNSDLSDRKLFVEYDYVNWIIFRFENNNSIVVERDDQVGTYCLFFNDEKKLNYIFNEVAQPSWGKIDCLEIR